MKLPVADKEIKIINYTTFWNRFFGLMFKKKKITDGFCFPHCNSIHTFFMRQTIDVVMTDENNFILHTFHQVKPWHIILPKKGVFCTFELPLHTANQFKVGSKLPIK